MNTEQYLDKINLAYLRGDATEHTYRSYLKELIESLAQDIIATNEPKRQRCGAPDYILTRKDIPVGFIEAKDIDDNDLKGEKFNKSQFDRYKIALGNIIFTDYLDFYLYRDGELVAQVRIGEVTDKGVKPLPANFQVFTNLIKDFCTYIGQTITSSQKLAAMMAGKARLMAEVIEKAILADQENEEVSSLVEQMQAFKEILMHDIVPKSFADVYAQTIVYGIFAARLNEAPQPPVGESFSRQKAYDLIPKSNPFLKKLFGYIAGLEVDDRIRWIVDSLVEVFVACDVQELLQDYGKNTQTEDAIIHFYETFLSEYDPNLRKARGVWYTPSPVVNFMVRAVDEILQTEFDLPKGLADNTKVPILSKDKTRTPPSGAGGLIHKVQILDPATGTGTFLAEVIKHIHQKFKDQQGIWNAYVEQDLLPRLNGFELLMASYAMAHLQLDLLLKSTGYTPPSGAGGLQRLRVYLTNSLEEPQEAQYKLAMAQWLADEGNEANKIKRETPVMCIIGNPPYSGESQNKSDWIMHLMEDYKKEPDNKGKLQEKNPKWLNDDYVKFLRYGQYFIEKNGSGVLAFINPHGFLDNPTFRGMRYNLLQTYDKIYTIDLHGNSKKKETAPDGSLDQNVFDIMQGVSINIFVKTGKKKAGELGKVFHFDLFGKREAKYDFLLKNSLQTVPYQELPNIAPNYFFVSKDFDNYGKYQEGFGLQELFTLNSVGIVTARDEFTIHHTEEKLKETIEDFLKLEDETARYRFDLGEDARDWQVSLARKDLEKCYPNFGDFIKLAYRPFDDRYTFYTGNSKGFHCMPRYEVMQHFLRGENVALVTVRRIKLGDNIGFFVANKIVDDALGGMSSSVACPLYLYLESEEAKRTEQLNQLHVCLEEAQITLENFMNGFTKVQKMYKKLQEPDKQTQRYYQEQLKQQTKLKKDIEQFKSQIYHLSEQNLFSEIEESKRIPNLNKEIIAQIEQSLGLTFVPEAPQPPQGEEIRAFFSPIDLLDYIYAVLQSPTYRETYQEFLKIDFPRVPYPTEAGKFWDLVRLGGELRQIHLLESEVVEKFITKYPVAGNNKVGKIHYENGKVYINYTPPSGYGGLQYFEGVPQVAWDFYIGGYQPAQKWLKDRKDRTLDFDDILHYQKIIVALVETDSIMKEIDKIKID